MSVRRPLLALVLALPALVPAARAADKPDKDGKKWLEEVAPLILQEEEKTYRSLKDKADRDEFQKIFWARRNPLGPGTAENPYKVEYEKQRAELDQRFKVPGRTGSATDCARVFILLGEPNDIKKEQTAGELGRPPEVWTYKDRPGFTFAGGQIQIPFDGQCQGPAGSGFMAQFQRPAEAKILNPNIGYTVGKDGHIVKLAELLPKASPAQALLSEPARQDFPLVAQPKVVIRGKEGATYVGGLVRGEGQSLSAQDVSGKKKLAVVVVAQAVDESGKVVASAEHEASSELAADGSFLGSFGLTLKPGKYTLRIGALDPKSNKGSVATAPVDVPDFGVAEISAADPMVIADVQEKPTQDPKDPLSAFYMGTHQLVPRFGNVFSQKEALQVIGFVYNAQADPATGKAQMTCRFAITKDGKPISTSEEQAFDATAASPGIGPVPLDKLQPGKYVVQLKVSDKLAKKDLTKEAAFEVTP